MHVDFDSAEIDKNVVADLPVVGDVRNALRDLRTRLTPLDPAHRAPYLAELATWRRKLEVVPWHTAGAWRDGLLSADYVVGRIGKIIGHDATLVADVGQNQMWTARYAGFRRPGGYLTSGRLGTMGYAMPAALGAALGAVLGRPNE